MQIHTWIREEKFPKIFQNCSEGQTNVSEHFPKIPEDFRRLPKTVEEDPKIFQWYTNYFKYNLRDKLDISEIIDIFTCEDIVLFLWICYHSVYHWLLYNNKQLFTKVEVNNCSSIYRRSWITSGPKSNFICDNILTKAIFFFFFCSEMTGTRLITHELANQHAQKVLFTCVVYLTIII